MERGDLSARIPPDVSGDLIESVLYQEWVLIRSAETVLWGRGHLSLDIIDADAKNYELRLYDNAAADDFDHIPHILVTPGTIGKDGGYQQPPLGRTIGMALGEVRRKIVPAVSPDVTAIRCEPTEEFEDFSEDFETRHQTESA